MNRIQALFATSKRPVVSIFSMAGFPYLEATVPLIQQLEKSGVDMVEIGMPFSDPLADGPAIQRVSELALKNGMNLDVLFHQLEELRKSVSIPVILMGYYNPVLQYGFERFCKQAAAVGVDGLILPDLPLEEFRTELRPIFQEHGLAANWLVTERTSPERLSLIDSLCSGFIYAVSAPGVTGAAQRREDILSRYLESLEQARLTHPVMVGFGISNSQQVREVSAHARGAIIGTAYLRAVESAADPLAATESFVRGLLLPS